MIFYAAFCSWATSFHLNEAPSVLHSLNLMNSLSLTTERAQGNASQSNCKRTGAYIHFVVSPVLEVAMTAKIKEQVTKHTLTLVNDDFLHIFLQLVCGVQAFHCAV